MATSNSYDFTTTRRFIITEAFRKIGGLGDGESLDDVRMQIGVNALNPMVKTFVAYGMLIWTLDSVSIPLSSWDVFSTIESKISIGPGQTYNMAYKPLKLLEASRYDSSNGSIVPLVIISNKEWEEQTNKNTEGIPNLVYYRPDAYDGQLHLWYKPDLYWRTNGSLNCVFQRPIQDFDSATDEPDFPAEWHEALIYNLAVRLAPNYGLAPNDRMILKEEAITALNLALSFDQEQGSLFIRPAYRGC